MGDVILVVEKASAVWDMIQCRKLDWIFCGTAFHFTATVTLKHVFDLTGPNLSNAEKLAAHIGVRSIRIVNDLLNNWKSEFAQTELSLCNDYCTVQAAMLFV